MKLIKQLFTFAAIALLITSCNKTDEFAPEQNSTFPADGVIRVATSVANPQTRAGMTTADLEEFEMSIVNEVNTTYSYNALMKKNINNWESYEKGSNTVPVPLTLLWQNKTQPVKVAAVASGIFPVGIDWNMNCTIQVNTTQDTEIEMKKSDILYMAEKVVNPTTDLVAGKVKIDFKHRFSKLNLTVNMGTEFNKLDGGTTTNLISEITVGGTSTFADWMIIEDNLVIRSGMQNITPWHNATAYQAGAGDIDQAQASYECILIPQTVAANGFTVSFKIGTRDFSWRSPTAVTLDADTQYNLTLNVGKDVVTVAGFTATPWTEADPQDLGTE